jgi:hypothetical protein
MLCIFKKNTTYSLNPAAVRLSVRAGTLNRKASGMTLKERLRARGAPKLQWAFALLAALGISYYEYSTYF